MRQDGVRRKIWYDECWRMMRVGNGHLAARLSAQQKLARQWGIGVWLIFHKLKDLSGTSPAMREIAEGMLSETGTRVSYHQAADQLEFTQQMLALTDTEASEIGGLDVGESLWQVEIRGKMRSFLIEHVYSGEEWPLLQTNSKMLGKTDTINTDTPSSTTREWGEVAWQPGATPHGGRPGRWSASPPSWSALGGAGSPPTSQSPQGRPVRRRWVFLPIADVPRLLGSMVARRRAEHGVPGRAAAPSLAANGTLWRCIAARLSTCSRSPRWACCWCHCRDRAAGLRRRRGPGCSASPPRRATGAAPGSGSRGERVRSAGHGWGDAPRRHRCTRARTLCCWSARPAQARAPASCTEPSPTRSGGGIDVDQA